MAADRPWTQGRCVADGPDYFGDYNIVLIEGDDRRAIAAVVSNMRPHAEVAANARLYAAATEMAEALRDLLGIEPSNVNDDDEQAAAFRNARELLARIERRS